MAVLCVCRCTKPIKRGVNGGFSLLTVRESTGEAAQYLANVRSAKPKLRSETVEPRLECRRAEASKAKRGG